MAKKEDHSSPAKGGGGKVCEKRAPVVLLV